MTKEELIARVKNDFIQYTHKSSSQVTMDEQTVHKYLELAIWLIETRPQSRQLSLALTELENSMLWCSAATARND